MLGFRAKRLDRVGIRRGFFLNLSFRGWLCFLFIGLMGASEPSRAAPPVSTPMKTGELFVLEDFDNQVTGLQAGTDYFSGNTGTLAHPESLAQTNAIGSELVPEATGTGHALRLHWNFANATL